MYLPFGTHGAVFPSPCSFPPLLHSPSFICHLRFRFVCTALAALHCTASQITCPFSLSCGLPRLPPCHLVLHASVHGEWTWAWDMGSLPFLFWPGSVAGLGSEVLEKRLLMKEDSFPTRASFLLAEYKTPVTGSLTWLAASSSSFPLVPTSTFTYINGPCPCQ
jgi:hypothetical protein